MNLPREVMRRARSLYKRLLPGCVVLCYHRVGEHTTDHWSNVVSPENFRAHMRLLARHYHPISMTGLIDALRKGYMPSKRTVVVTFDDGYASNLVYAYDSLREYQIPALFYMTTYTLDSPSYFWWDELQSILAGSQELPNSIPLDIFSESIEAPYLTENQRLHAFGAIHKILKGIEPDARTRILSRLASRKNDDGQIEERKPLDRSGILETASEKLFEIGGHTHSHCALSLLAAERQAYEIRENKRILEEIAGRTISHFSYPFGGDADFDDVAEGFIKEAGFSSSVTTSRKVLRIGDDPYRIPRMSVKNWDEKKLKSNIERLWSQ